MSREGDRPLPAGAGSSIEPSGRGSLHETGKGLGDAEQALVRPAGDLAVEGEGRVQKVLSFRVAYLQLAIALDRIRIVQRSEGIDPLPESPRNVVGLMELSPGESVPVIDLAHSLGIRTAGEAGYEGARMIPEPLGQPQGTKEHVLIYNSTRGTVGFLIDRAEAVVEAMVHPLPEALAETDSSLQGIARTGAGTAYLLDLERHVLPP